MPGPYFVRSTDGSDADAGTSWALAKATLAGAFAVAAAGDTIYVSDNHAETQASAMTLTSPGTAGNPVYIYCVDDAGDPNPPTALATTATVTTTGTFGITLKGFAYVYGITFTSASGAGAADFTFGATSTSSGWTMEACALRIGTSSSAARLRTFGTAGTATDNFWEWINTPVQFAAIGQGIANYVGRLSWRGTASAVTGATVPTTLFLPPAGALSITEVASVDLSALGSSKNLVSAANAAGPSRIYFRNCKLGASVNVLTGTIPGPGAHEVYLDNSDSGATNYRMEHYVYEGSTVNETTKVRTGGASDGTTPISWKMTSLTTGPTFHTPFRSAPLYIWNDTTGSSKTATVEILHDSVTALTDGEVWLQVEYLGSSSDPGGTIASDRKTNNFSSAANQTTSSATWTTTGLTNPNKQKLEVTFTPQTKGLIRARVALAKANYTIYIDPLVTLS